MNKLDVKRTWHIIVALVVFALSLGMSLRTRRSDAQVSFTGSLSGSGGSIPANLPFCFAAYGGNDSNSGQFVNQPKASIMGCYDALPSAGGTISFVDGGSGGSTKIPACKATDPSGCGIYIGGPLDPNYASFGTSGGTCAPIACTAWRKAKPVRFVGKGGTCSSQQGTAPQVCVSAGGASSPGIWLSSATNSVSFENMSISYPNPSVEIGVDSTGTQTGTSGWIGAWFSNLYTNPCNSCSSSVGPGWLIGGGNSFDIHITRSNIVGNHNATAGSDNQAAILIKPTGGLNAVGPMWIDHTVLTFGGLIMYAGGTSENLFVEDSYSEGINAGAVTMGTIWLPTGGVTAVLGGVFSADTTGAVCDIFSGQAVNSDPSHVIYTGGLALNACGPAEVHGPVVGTATETPTRWGQVGFVGRHVIGQTDASRRNFPPTATRFTNLATTPSGSRVTAPDGTTNALEAGDGSLPFFYHTASFSNGVGDWLVGGVWVRSATANGYYQGLSPAKITAPNLTLAGPTPAYCSVPWQGDGEWEWCWVAQKITANAGPDQLTFEGLTSAGITTDYYAPVFMVITANTVSDNEAVEIASNLSTYRSDAVAGDVSLLPGERFESDSIIQQSVAPSGSCTQNGTWVFSQDGHATVCLSGTWTSKI